MHEVRPSRKVRKLKPVGCANRLLQVTAHDGAEGALYLFCFGETSARSFAQGGRATWRGSRGASWVARDAQAREHTQPTACPNTPTASSSRTPRPRSTRPRPTQPTTPWPAPSRSSPRPPRLTGPGVLSCLHAGTRQPPKMSDHNSRRRRSSRCSFFCAVLFDGT